MGQEPLKILATGGLGYLGGRISKSLFEKGAFLVRLGIRKLNRKLPVWLKESAMVPIDLESREPLDEACRGVDAIIHLAALNEIESAHDPERAFLVNSFGTQRLLQAAIRTKVKRFIYLSTAHVYGSPLAGIITEGTLPRPVHPYAITHLAAEHWVTSAHRQRLIEGVVIRLSNGFGAPATTDTNRWTLIVNDLCQQAVMTGKMLLRSPGLQQRDFIPLSDACRGVLHLLELPASQLGDGLFNLGGNCSLKIIEIAWRIAQRSEQVLGVRPAIEHLTSAVQEPSLPLDYRMDKLAATGFALSGDMSLEIDETLHFCKKSFQTLL